MKRKEKIQKIEQDLRDQSRAFLSTLETLNDIDPVAASGMFKQTMQYIAENTVVMKGGVFTIQQLEELGYL